MNPILADIYSTVLPSAPFIIVAYVMLWVVLVVYAIMIARGLKGTEKQMGLLEKRMNHIDVVSAEEDGESRSEMIDAH